jgi:dTMP kinase
LLLGGGTEWSPLAEAMLHFAARAEHVARTIRPAMEAGMDVVCDRFTDSTMAYQAYGQGADPEVIAGFARLMDFTPDLTLVLDVSEPVAKSRLAARGGAADRYEAEAASFHARVRAGFRAIAAADPARCVLIPADGHVTEVHAAVMAAVARVVP